MEKLVYSRDLKSLAARHAGSTPAPGTILEHTKVKAKPCSDTALPRKEQWWTVKLRWCVPIWCKDTDKLYTTTSTTNMKTLVEKSPHYNNFSDTGDSLVNGSPKDTMVSLGFEVESLWDEYNERKRNRVVYHYPDVSSSLYLYEDGSYGVISG